MSFLWSAEVTELRGATVSLRIRAIHPDSGQFAPSKHFALLLVLDRAYELDASRRWVATGPLGAAIPRDRAIAEAGKADVVDRFIQSVTVSDVANAPFDDAALRRDIEARLHARGIDPGTSRWQSAFDQLWNEFWTDEARIPRATYTIEATDERWLVHLQVGQKWDSAAYP